MGDNDAPGLVGVTTDLDGHSRRIDDPNTPDGGNGTPPIVDMGAYEFGSTYFGDMNCDGSLNSLDIDPFVIALIDPPGYETAYPNCNIDLADCNSDGSVDSLDIDLFVDLLTG